MGGGDADDRGRQRLLIIADHRSTTPRRSRLTDHATSTALRDLDPGAHMLDTVAAAGGARYFPSIASFRISLSSISSDTA
jgi:hypothetical protein